MSRSRLARLINLAGLDDPLVVIRPDIGHFESLGLIVCYFCKEPKVTLSVHTYWT